MKLHEIVEKLGLTVHTGHDHLDREARAGYASDMLSDVIGNAPEGAVWVTIQKHQNVVAVAVMKSLAAIVLAQGRVPEETTVRKAQAEGIVILSSPEGVYALVGKLHALGLGNE